MALRTQKTCIFLVNTAAQWFAGIHPRTEKKKKPQVKRSHYKQILYYSLHFWIYQRMETNQIFLHQLKKTSGCGSRQTPTPGPDFGTSSAAPRLQPDPAWPILLSVSVPEKPILNMRWSRR